MPDIFKLLPCVDEINNAKRENIKPIIKAGVKNENIETNESQKKDDIFIKRELKIDYQLNQLNIYNKMPSRNEDGENKTVDYLKYI